MLWIDLETRSQVDLKSQGLHRYADSPTTEVICMSYAFDDEAITTWFSEDGQFPLPVSRYIESGGAIYAHNASFERIIFEKVLGIDVALTQWRCSAARAMYSGLPAALKNLCIALELPIQKQSEGTRLIREYSMPDYLTEWKDGDRQLMQDYCEMDVATMRLACKLLPEPSDEMWRQYHITEDINDHGVPVDVSFAAAAIERSGEIREDVNQQLSELTGGLVTRHTERKSRDQWFRDNFTDEQLLPLLDEDEKIKFDKPRREALMTRAETPEALAKYAELIESAGGSTVSKYESMVNTHIDGTVRGSLIWSGAASTGRYSSKGLQLQNFKRNVMKEPQKYIDKVINGEDIDSPADTLARLVRSAIVSEHGLTYSDYSQIEARVLPWLSGDPAAEDTLDVFREGRDIYTENAKKMFSGKTAPADPRQAAKQGVLACLHPDSMVITSNGIKKLIEVSLDDQLWDGSAWVHHSGLVYRGLKETIEVDGVWMTKDHLVKTQSGWVEAQQVVSSPNTLQSAQGIGLDALQLLASSMGPRGGLDPYMSSAIAEQMHTQCSRTAYVMGKLSNATDALKEVLQRLTQSILMYCQIGCIGGGSCLGYRGLSTAATTQNRKTTPTMVGEVLGSPPNGTVIGQPSLRTLLLWMGGMIPHSTLTDSTIMGITKRVISLLGLGRKTATTGEQLPNYKPRSTNWSSVYDIADAGPNNCFTVLSDSGSLVVHNCGFGGGARAVMAMAKNYGMSLTYDEADSIKSAWRRANPWAEPFWYGLKRAAEHAISAPNQIFSQGKLKFLYDGSSWLWMMLPSGRCLSYYQPEWEFTQAPWEDEPTEKLTVLWGSGKRKAGEAWPRRALTHIILAENATQGCAADLMREAIVRAYDAELPVLFSVHDELVCEGSCSAELHAAMITSPDWAEGLPIDADTVEAQRYGK